MKRTAKGLLAGILALACVAAAGFALSGKSISVGRYLRAGNGTHIVIDGGGTPVIMRDQSGGDALFDGLETGDKVLVVCGGATTAAYPGRNVASWCLRLGDGAPGDLPQDTLERLAQLGWLSFPL